MTTEQRKIYQYTEDLSLLKQAVASLEGNPLCYNFLEIKDFVLGKKNIISGLEEKIAYTVAQMWYNDKERYDLYLLAIEYFKKQDTMNKIYFTWPEMVLYITLLEFLYKRFFKLSENEKELLLRNYLYKAIVLGLQIRESLRKYLLESEWWLTFISRHEFLLSNLEKNIELVVEDTTIRISDLFFGINKDIKIFNSERQNSFIDDFCRKNNLKDHKVWLQDLIKIYCDLKFVRLVDWQKEMPFPDEQEHPEDLLRLYISFVYGGEFLKIVEYYKQEKPKLSLQVFLKKLAKHINLSNSDDLEKCLLLSETLRKNNILLSHQDFIVFDQPTNQFHWNLESLS